MIQYNLFNRQRSISIIVFILYAVCKTSFHYISIITMTQHILICSMTFESFTASVSTVIILHIFYLWEVKLYRVYCWNIETCVKISNRCLQHNKFFLLRSFPDIIESGYCKHKWQFFFYIEW